MENLSTRFIFNLRLFNSQVQQTLTC